MSIWLGATLVLVISLVPAGIAAIRGDMLDRLVGVQLGGIISTFTFITVGVWAGQSIYVDVAVVMAILTFCGGLAYAHFLERWL